MNEREWRTLEEHAPVERVEVAGRELRRGDRVRLRPGPRGDVLNLVLGVRKPTDCPALGRECTPDHPLGATMSRPRGRAPPTTRIAVTSSAGSSASSPRREGSMESARERILRKGRESVEMKEQFFDRYGAVFALEGGRVAFSTDSYVVSRSSSWAATSASWRHADRRPPLG